MRAGDRCLTCAMPASRAFQSAPAPMRAGDAHYAVSSNSSMMFQSAPAPMRAGDFDQPGIDRQRDVSIRAGSHESRRLPSHSASMRETPCFNPRRLP